MKYLLSILIVLTIGCAKRNHPREVKPHIPPPAICLSQPKMLKADYPEWAKKEWVLLCFIDVEYRGTVRRGNMFHSYTETYPISQGEYHYVDQDSFDGETKSYQTIECETLSVGENRYKIDKKNSVTCHFEGYHKQGWIFPCTQEGLWHSGTHGEHRRDLSVDSVVMCEHCGRFYQRGRVYFPRENGCVGWSRN
jgi:hypothetical protein